MSNPQAYVKIPASTANLGPGFDCLGLALNLYTWIEMKISEETKIHLHGEQMAGISNTKSNLVYKVAQQVFDEAGVNHPDLEISMYSEIPLTRGLGSSASAIVGGMAGANALIGNALTQDKIFQMASRLENHPDNVGASLFGGLITAFWDGNRAEYIRMEPDPRLEILVVIPEFHLSTEKARNALPGQVSMEDAVFNVGHSSLLVAALSTGNLSMIKHAMKDRLHQPYRASLIPGMRQILLEAEHHGALGVALSGAGPTLLALVDVESDSKDRLEAFLIDTLLQENVKAHTLWLKPCSEGVQLLTHYDINSTFMQNIKGEIWT